MKNVVLEHAACCYENSAMGGGRQEGPAFVDSITFWLFGLQSGNKSWRSIEVFKKMQNLGFQPAF